MADIKQILSEVLTKAKEAKSQEDALRQAKNEQDRMAILNNVGADLAASLKPILEKLPESARISQDQIRQALSDAIQVNVPPVDTEGLATRLEQAIFSAISQIPTPQINVPAPQVSLPTINIPKSQFPTQMNVGLENYTAKNPLPVMMMDMAGKPFQFSFPSSSGGGKADFFTIKDIRTSSGASIIDQVEGAMKVTGNFTVSAAGASSVSLVNSDGTYYNSDNPLPVTFASSVQPVSQVSGASWSVYVSGSSGSIATSILNGDGNSLDPRDRNWTITESLNVNQVSGANWTINAADIFATTATSTVVNPDNRVRVELPATTITGITNTIAAANVDSSGVQYSGSNPLPITIISGALTSTIAVGDIASDGADTGSAPIKTGGIARQTNPTAVADGDRVSFTSDDLGRQIMRPLQVRDLILTAYTSIANGTETTLRAAVAGAKLDMIMLVLGNNSDAAVTVDVRGATAGNVEMSVVVPPYGTAGYSGSTPWPQSETGNNWTIDMPDITGTTVYASAEFSQEV